MKPAPKPDVHFSVDETAALIAIRLQAAALAPLQDEPLGNAATLLAQGLYALVAQPRETLNTLSREEVAFWSGLIADGLTQMSEGLWGAEHATG